MWGYSREGGIRCKPLGFDRPFQLVLRRDIADDRKIRVAESRGETCGARDSRRLGSRSSVARVAWLSRAPPRPGVLARRGGHGVRDRPSPTAFSRPEAPRVRPFARPRHGFDTARPDTQAVSGRLEEPMARVSLRSARSSSGETRPSDVCGRERSFPAGLTVMLWRVRSGFGLEDRPSDLGAPLGLIWGVGWVGEVVLP